MLKIRNIVKENVLDRVVLVRDQNREDLDQNRGQDVNRMIGQQKKTIETKTNVQRADRDQGIPKLKENLKLIIKIMVMLVQVNITIKMVRIRIRIYETIQEKVAQSTPNIICKKFKIC